MRWTITWRDPGGDERWFAVDDYELARVIGSEMAAVRRDVRIIDSVNGAVEYESNGADAGRDVDFSAQKETMMTKVLDVMTPEVAITRASDTIEAAAQTMAAIDAGVLPVSEDDRLVGMITDRDIAVRCVAGGFDPKSTPVSEVMSDNIKYCFADQDVDHIVGNMAELQIRRLPVLDRSKRLVGIVSLGDIAAVHQPNKIGKALGAISRPVD